MRIAVVGLGHMGRIHLNKLTTFPDLEVTAIVDALPEVVEQVSSNTGTKGLTSFTDAIGLCDAAVIATPTETHHAVAKAFLSAGKHVFMEKPITVLPSDAEELIDIARRNALVFQIGHLERFNPAFIEALSFIKRPTLIEATRISPFTGRSVDVDVVLDLMIHDLDLVLSCSASEVSDITAQGVCFLTDKCDAASARIDFADGSVATITASRMSSKKERTITVYEEDRHLSIDLLQGTVSGIVKNPDGTINNISFSASRMDPVSDELRQFIDSIEGRTTPIVTGSDGLRALLLAARIRDCIAGKRRVVSAQS